MRLLPRVGPFVIAVLVVACALLGAPRRAEATLIWQLVGDSLNGSVANGGSVTSWTALAGPGATGSAGTAPTLLTNAFAGHSAVHFDGSNDSLSGAVSPVGQMTLFVVLRASSFSTSPQNFLNSHDSSGNAGGFNAFIYDTTGVMDHIAFQYSKGTGWTGGANFLDAGSSIGVNATVLYGATIGSSASELYLNGTSIASNGGGLMAAGRAATTIGMDGNNPGTSYFNGDIAEIRIYDTALDAATRQSIETELNNRYVLGLPDVPEPASIGLAALAAGALAARARRRRRE